MPAYRVQAVANPERLGGCTSFEIFVFLGVPRLSLASRGVIRRGGHIKGSAAVWRFPSST